MKDFDIFQYGFAYEFVMLMLLLAFILDAVGLVKTLFADKEEKKEYARLCIKWLKILMMAAAGGIYLYLGLFNKMDSISSGIHIVLAAMLLLDAVGCLAAKIGWARKEKKK